MRTTHLLSLVAAALVACGGSVSGDDAGGDASVSDSPISADATPTETSTIDSPASSLYDGTVGKACTSDADCHSATGPNKAKCSSSVFAPEDYYPTPVCIIPSCTPVSDSKTLHYCDGPDDSSSPGVCVEGFGGGICLPKCSYDQNGGAPTGCTGKNTCAAYVSTPENGFGYCWGGCTKDPDCSNGQKCQTDQGLCEKGVTPPAKTFGAACTQSDTNALVCNCLYGTNNTGYCTDFCIVGQTTCPNGSVCDPFEYHAYGYNTPNTGMSGYCTVTCAGDAAACPAASTCTNLTASGPDCVPP